MSIRFVVLCLSSVLMLPSAMAHDWFDTAGDVMAVALPLTALTATFTLDDAPARSPFLLSYGASVTSAYGLQRLQPSRDQFDDFAVLRTASAFSSASFLAKRYGRDVGIPAFLAATITGASDIRRHESGWASVVASAVLAMAANEWLVAEKGDTTLALLPLMDGAQVRLITSF